MSIVDWDNFVTYQTYQYHHRVVYRKLVYPGKTKEKLQALEKFLQAAKGKRYSLKLGKFVKRNDLTDFDENIKEGKTFFCSELVAAIYKNLGILSKERAASNYWPVDFSEKTKLRMLNGAYLEQEKLLEFYGTD